MMNYKVLLIALLGISSSIIYGQTPEQIGVITGNKEMVCNGTQNAGSVSSIIADPSNVGSEISITDTTFLCFEDGARAIHEGNYVLDGDPDPSTPAEIGYAFYSCAPSIIGDNLGLVQSDPCVINDPPTANGLYIARGQPLPNPDLLMNNDGSINQDFNNGLPTLITFAPITFDHYVNMPVFENSGSCVNVNIFSAFRVVYLNAIQEQNVTTAGLNGQFTLIGGYPEWNNNANYSLVSIENVNDPSITGSFNTPQIRIGETAEFSVPQDGNYRITVEDDKSCPLTFEVEMRTDAVILDIGELEVGLGDNFCVPITVQNFDSIVSVTFALTFDPNVISYLDFDGWQLSQSFIVVNDNSQDEGLLTFNWFSDDLENGESLADGEILIEFCFTTAPNANIGDMTPVNLTTRGTTILEVLSARNGEVNLGIDPGKVTITSPDLTGTAISCGSLPAETDGNIVVSVFSGVAPYTVSITGPVNRNGNVATEGGSITFNNLPPGDYDIRITDNAGDTYNFTKTVYDGGPNNQPRPAFQLDEIQPPSCNGSTDGSIGISYDPGDIADPFSISWSNGQFNAETISNLAQGNYRVSVTDRFGCEETSAISLEINEIEINSIVTDASCSGYDDGSAIVTATGGSPINGSDYRFRWQAGGGGNQTADEVTLTNLTSGWTTITITDDNGCQKIDSFFVSADRRLFLENFTITPASCFGENDGAIEVEAGTQGGTANLPYIIDIIDPNNNNVATATGPESAEANGLSAGTYEIVITDMTSPNACVFDTQLVVTQPDSIQLDIDKRDETCQGGGNDGTITVNPIGGTGPYTFNWATLSNSNSHSNLSPGTYNLTVTDANLCTATASVSILTAQPPTLLGIDATPPSCPELCDGEITINVRPNPDFEIVRYQIIRGGAPLDTFTNETSLTIGGYCGGDLYQVREIEDAAGCIASPPNFDDFPERDSLALDTAFLLNPTCDGRTDGRIIIQLEGATAPYIYQWENQDRDTSFIADTLNNLAAGTYQVTVSDINNCGNLELEFTLVDPPLLDATFSNVTDASCFNSCDAAATVTANGGNPLAGNYSFEWSSGTTGSGANHTTSDLCAGDQFVIISDGICIDTFPIEINAPDAITIDTLAIELPSCFGDADGLISVEARGGAGNFNYSWENGPSNSSYDNIPAGDYILTTTDGNGCSRMDTFRLPNPDSLIVFFDPTDVMNPSCPGEVDGMLIATTTGGTGALNFMWTNDISQNDEANGLDVGLYGITVTDQNGCTDTASAELVTAPPLTVVLPDPDTPLCSDGTTPYLISDVQGGNGGPYTYTINNSAITPIGSPVSVESGVALITINDINGCVLDTMVTIPSRQAIEINIDPEQELRLGASLTFNPIVTGPYPIVSYSWSPSAGLSCDDCPNPEVNPAVNTTYTLTVTDINGCTAQQNVSVILNTQRDIYIPNVFSPNADDVNDIFRVYSGPGVASLRSFQIYDRWGSLIWEGRNIAPSAEGSEGWDGTYNGRPADPGVYVYAIEILFLDNRVITYRGDITLLNGIPKN